jgi:sugar phosphate isomerase/epimerase
VLRLAYNTNGFPQHELSSVVDVLADLGYAGIAITPDVLQLNPFGSWKDEAVALRSQVSGRGLAVAVETGARFVLDRRRKHRPTLLDAAEGADVRLDLLKRCHAIAVELGAETLSFWSGTAPDELSDDEAVDRLCHGAGALLDEAKGSGVQVAFEPEPGMAVASIGQLAEFLLRLDRPELGVMLDVGHVPVTEILAPHEIITAWADRIVGIQLDDSRDGVHEHLFPGDGEIDFAAVADALDAVDFTGLAALELPRHAADPVTTATEAIAFFRALGSVP